ncbi:14607_t:CDS:2, partial [Acaulospora colombiana]
IRIGSSVNSPLQELCGHQLVNLTLKGEGKELISLIRTFNRDFPNQKSAHTPHEDIGPPLALEENSSSVIFRCDSLFDLFIRIPMPISENSTADYGIEVWADGIASLGGYPQID